MLRLPLVLLMCAGSVGCADDERIRNPDGRDHDVHVDRDVHVPLRDVVGAVGAVSVREAPATLERWLSVSPEGRALLAKWPRAADGTLDLDRAPVRVRSLDASLEPGSKSRCGRVTVVFETPGPALRMRLTVPGSAPTCRGRSTASALHGSEALPLLHLAIADARVPIDTPSAPPLAAN